MSALVDDFDEDPNLFDDNDAEELDAETTSVAALCATAHDVASKFRGVAPDEAMPSCVLQQHESSVRPSLRHDADRDDIPFMIVELAKAVCDRTADADASSPALTFLLAQCFGHSSFRDGQVQAVLHTLRGEPAFVSLPTGFGKSICYMLPTVVLQRLAPWVNALATRGLPCGGASGLDIAEESPRKLHRPEGQSASTMRRIPGFATFCVVIAPLMALIQDQLEAVRQRNAGNGEIRAMSISSTTAQAQQQTIFSEMRRLGQCNATAGETLFNVLFISPERLVGNAAFQAALKAALPAVAFVAVDEAHCVSEWSHDFRPCFMYCKATVDRLAREAECTAPAFLALTATATPVVADSVCRMLGLQHRVVRDLQRSNLSWTVTCDTAHLSAPSAFKQAATSNESLDENSNDAARQFSESVMFKRLEDEVIAQCRVAQRPVLLYVTTQADADHFAARLRSVFEANGGKDVVRSYHAGMDGFERRKSQRGFMQNSITMLVATVAFGMGIDKSDVRTVIHCRPPPRLEAYLQEAGRAGRDGAPSTCCLLFDPMHFFEHRRRALQSVISFHQTRSVIQETLRGGGVPNDGLRIVNVTKLALELSCANEVVETLIYGVALQHPHAIQVLRQAPQKLRCYKFDEADELRSGAAPGAASYRAAAGRGRNGKPRKGSASGNGLASLSAVEAEVNRAFGFSDVVWDMCVRQPNIPDVVVAARLANVSVTDFIDRVNGFVSAGRMKCTWGNYGLLVKVSTAYTDDEHVATLAKEAFQRSRSRVRDTVTSLRLSFGVFAAGASKTELPGMDAIESTEAKSWQPPQPTLTLGAATDVIADFFQRCDRNIVDSATVGAKVLLGAIPFDHPLSRSVYKGKLTDMNEDWVFKACEAVYAALPDIDR